MVVTDKQDREGVEYLNIFVSILCLCVGVDELQGLLHGSFRIDAGQRPVNEIVEFVDNDESGILFHIYVIIPSVTIP